MSKLKMKAALKYQLRDYRNIILIMYLCVYLAVLAILTFGNTKISSSSGFELASMVTIFVVGLNSFKENFKFFSANGVSRRTQLCSTVAALGILSTVFAFIDTINSTIFTHIMVYRPMLIQAYGPRYGYPLNFHAPYSSPVLTPQMLAENFLWLFCTCFFLSMVGLFITTLYYQMNKGLKIAVSIAVSVLLIYGTPTLDSLFFGGKLSRFLQSAANVAWGFSNGYNPYIGMISMLVFTALFTALSYLLARKANVKE